MENPKKKKVLEKLYYSLDSPVSFAGKEKLYNAAKQKNASFSRKEVDEWLKAQITYTLHKPVRQKFKTRPVIVHEIDEQWQMDLVDLSKLSTYNRGYKFLLVCIDVLSKFAWIEPLKTKRGQELKGAIINVFKRDNRQPKLLQTDKGSEFLNSIVKSLLSAKNIKLFTTNSERKASVVERLNRTMKSIMFKYFTKKNTRKYIDVLQDLVDRYNNSYHRSIKMCPSDVNKANESQVWMNLYSKVASKSYEKRLDIGDVVRISIERLPFQKRYQEIWTEEVFIVTHYVYGNPTVYKISDQAGEEIKGTFYYEELQKVVEPDAYRIERIIRKKKTANGKFIYYVKWKGYSDKFNSYVSAEDLQQQQ